MRIAVLGAGTWGMALARNLCVSGHEVTVWSSNPQELHTLRTRRRHRHLPQMDIPETIAFSEDMGECCRERELIIMAVPSVRVRAVARELSPLLRAGQIVVDAAKGIEPGTLFTMTEVIRSEIGQGFPVAAISGPTHAEEVSMDLPTTIVAACEDLETAEKVQAALSNSVMRVYTNTDVKGVELCGALKNVIALACGISAGLGYGDNTKAALITRGLAEIERLGLRMGCLSDTFSGLAGMGDLIVTATSRHSRNNRCGYLIGQGYELRDAIRQVGMVVEGINAIPAAMELAEKYRVDMPIIQAVHRVVELGEDPRDAVRGLMGRNSKTELTAFPAPGETADKEPPWD